MSSSLTCFTVVLIVIVVLVAVLDVVINVMFTSYFRLQESLGHLDPRANNVSSQKSNPAVSFVT